jgi:hypothetical protein
MARGDKRGESFRQRFFNKYAPHLQWDSDKHGGRHSPIVWDHSGDDPIAVSLLKTKDDNDGYYDHFSETMFGRTGDPKFLGKVDVDHYASDPLYAMAAKRAGVSNFNSANDVRSAIDWLMQRDAMDDDDYV